MTRTILRKEQLAGISIFIIGAIFSFLLFITLYVNNREQLRYELDNKALESTQLPEEDLKEVIEGFHASFFRLPYIYLLTGLIVSGLFARYVQILVNRRNTIESEFEQRTQALTESEAHLRSILNNALDGIITIDQLGNVQTFNPAAEKIFGYLADEVVGNNVSMLMPEPYQNQHDRFIRSYLNGSGGTIVGKRCEVLGKRKDGTTFPLAIALSEMRIGNTLQFMGIARDITEMNKAESALKLSEERLKQFFQASTEAIFIHEGGIILDANQAITEIFGYETGEVIGKNLLNYVSPESKETVIRMMQTLEHWGIEIYAIKRDGSRIPITIHAKTLYLDDNRAIRVVAIQDISEQKQTEEKLRVSEERIRAIVDTVIDAIITIDSQGIVQTFNPAAEKIFGYAADEVIGSNVSMLMPDPYHSNHDNYITNYQQTSEAKIIGIGREVVGKKKDGSTFPMELAVAKTEVAGNHIFTGLVRDITKHKEWEQALIEAKDIAEKANSAKSQFLSSMSHELRTPLNAIMGYTQLLTYENNLTPQQKLNAQEAYKAGSHLLDLINDVLDLTKIEEGHLHLSTEPVSLEILMDECYSLIEPLTREPQITLKFHCKPCFVLGDHTRLKQVLLNLLSNAVKYNRQGGKVHVTCEQGIEGQIHISVEDTGQGIEKSQINQLYQPFNRLGAESGNIEGTGIGLMITKRIVEMMNGTISVESTPGVGTRFEIALPQADASSIPTPPHNTRNNVDLASKRSGHILLLEDNPTNQALFQQQLSMLGQSVSVVSNGEEGLRQWQTGDFDLVLSDINMPIMDGYEFVRSLRQAEQEENRTRTPVIAITANALTGEEERCLSEGMDDYFSKPVDLSRLEHTLKRWLPASDTMTNETLEEDLMADDNRQTPENDSPIDPTALTRMVGDDHDMHRLLLEKFIQTTPATIQQFHKACSEKRADIVGQLGHKLKSSARAIGANELADVCQELEQAGKTTDWEAIFKLVSRLDPSMNAVHQYVQQF